MLKVQKLYIATLQVLKLTYRLRCCLKKTDLKRQMNSNSSSGKEEQSRLQKRLIAKRRWKRQRTSLSPDMRLTLKLNKS